MNRTSTPRAKSANPEELITSKQKSVFTIVMVLSPLIFFGMIEMILYFSQYGGDFGLVTKKTMAGREFYSINRSVARRYFVQMGSVVPEPADDSFAIRKTKNTKRIFCLGESTMAGFPYEFHATAPSFLRDRLSALLPGYNIEVVNVGLSAVGTFVVQDFLDELLSYEPDLFIIYLGHNEFYGIYGAGSSKTIPGGPWVTRLNIALLKFRTYMLLRDGYLWLQSVFAKTEKKASPSLMGEMVGNGTIALHSETYETARRIYSDNLERLIHTAKAGKVPIMFSTLVSNWRGQRPFVSSFDQVATLDHQTLWRGAMMQGDSAHAHGNLEKALQYYTNATKIDSMNAEGFFKLGTVLYSATKYSEAKSAFLQAKDLDALRFRATEEFQEVLIDVCRRQDVPLARVDSAFINASPHGILDDSLFLEHLHPNVSGYFLMAKVLCKSIQEYHLLVPPGEWTQHISDSTLMDLSRVTEFDRTVGTVKIDLLKRRWPFETGQVNYEFTASNSIESVVFRMIKGGIAWSDARYLLAEFYARNKQYDLARKECLAVSKVIPFHYEPLLRYADYFNVEGERILARESYRRCFETDDNPYARIKYAMLCLEEENASTAVAQLDTAFVLDARGVHKLSSQGAATGRYLLGVGYAKLGKLGLAKENAERALAIDPTYDDARDLLSQLRGLSGSREKK